jgi:hydrogenase expression/formation protein HypC
MCLSIPGRVLDIREERSTKMATADFGGIRKDVCLAYLPDVQVGDYVLVHVGFAITQIDEQSAQETLALFESLGMLEADLGADAGGSR